MNQIEIKHILLKAKIISCENGILTYERDGKRNSGKNYTSDFAVFHTDPAEFNTSPKPFEELAYSIVNKNYTTLYDYTLISQL